MPKISASARRALTEGRRKQILDAATKVFAAKGFDRATIADIAHEAGIAEGSIYNYFKNKGDLLVSIPRQVVQLPIETASAQLRAFVAGTPLPPKQILTATAHNVIAAVRQNRHIFRILVSALPMMSQATRDRYMNQVVLYVLQMLETYFQEQIQRGVFRKGLKPEILSRAFVGMFFPFVMLSEILLAEPSAKWDYDQLIAEIVPMFLHGVLAEGTARPDRQAKRAQKIAIG